VLSKRRQTILAAVVEIYLREGRPVPSRMLAERDEPGWSPSSIRSELAALEDEGLLTHPHTSAGRIPTDAGYRFYVEQLLSRDSRTVAATDPASEVHAKREVYEAIRETTEALARFNDLVALVTAPPIETATVHRVEVLRLRPRVVTVVVIASNGEVTKRVFTFPEEVDPGLVSWAGSYLNERLTGIGVGARMLAGRLADPDLGRAEREFVAEIESTFTDLGSTAQERLYVDGTDRLLESVSDEMVGAAGIVGALERRMDLLETLRTALERDSVYAWIGEENPAPELRSVSVVGANYGLGYRNLGAVGVIGPVRMDYPKAIASVQSAADDLSRFFETVYEG
jgi:heat-inducible transcriptional repressor